MKSPDRSQALTSRPAIRERRLGLVYGFIGVASFSLTLPATRIAVVGLDAVFVGLGRAVIAAILASIVLAWTRSPWPGKSVLPRLAIVAGGVIIGFPLLTTYAMKHAPASHGAIVVGLLPLATALAATWLAHERPKPAFWVSSAFGSTVVVGFALWQGGGSLHLADLLLVLAVASAATGYAEGGRLARSLGGWQVICWALVLAAPIMLVVTLLNFDKHVFDAPASSWIGFAYLSAVSMFLGFFAWYRGLALGGIAAVGQVQLLQVFLTILASAWLLHEHIHGMTYIAASLVIASIALGRKVQGNAALPANPKTSSSAL